MSADSDSLRLRDMLDRAERIMSYMEGRTVEDLACDHQLQDAVLHCFLILGEAASKVSPAIKERFSELPWQQMVGIRNHIVHGYTRVDFHIIWKTTEEDIPSLIASLLQILPPEQI